MTRCVKSNPLSKKAHKTALDLHRQPNPAMNRTRLALGVMKVDPLRRVPVIVTPATLATRWNHQNMRTTQ
jgi:hypothetical protein